MSIGRRTRMRVLLLSAGDLRPAATGLQTWVLQRVALDAATAEMAARFGRLPGLNRDS